MKKKFCALPKEQADSGDMFFYGTGETPYKAMMDFKRSPDFWRYCEYSMTTPGEIIPISIYSVIGIEESNYPVEERDPNWEWCIGEHIFTVHVKVPNYQGKNE